MVDLGLISLFDLSFKYRIILYRLIHAVNMSLQAKNFRAMNVIITLSDYLKYSVELTRCEVRI